MKYPATADASVKAIKLILASPWILLPTVWIAFFWGLGDTALYDLDGFRARVFESRTVRLPADPSEFQAARDDDGALLTLAMRWVKTVLFNSPAA